jgi:hypothetical protein
MYSRRLCFSLFGLLLALQSPVTASPRDELVRIAEAEIGVVEKTGQNDGERIKEYLAVTGLSEGYPWCAAFVAWCHLQAKISSPHSAYSPDWFKTNVIWRRDRDTQEHSQVEPQSGDVFGIYFSSLERVAHVGIVKTWRRDVVVTIEGNSNPDGGREGYGVFSRRRLTSQIYVVSSYIKQ